MKKRDLHILVPRLMDVDNINAQNLNARAMLARFKLTGIVWHVFCYGEPDPAIAARTNIRCHMLRKGRLWSWHALVLYQGGYDAIFYPANEWYDLWALRLRRWSGRRIPVLATMEAIPGDSNREAELSRHFGGEIYCLRPRSGPAWIASHDGVRALSDRIVSISPFLNEVASFLYRKPGAVCPLGVDLTYFHARDRVDPGASRLVVGAGTLYEAKRPQLFIELALCHPEFRFVWFGGGPLLESLLQECHAKGVSNLDFPGAVLPAVLAAALRKARLFVLPSKTEGVPKVTQEAAACGVPVISFAYYRSPVVVDGVNGYVVHSVSEFHDRVKQLLLSDETTRTLGAKAAAMASDWDWNSVALQWEAVIAEWRNRLQEA